MPLLYGCLIWAKSQIWKIKIIAEREIYLFLSNIFSWWYTIYRNQSCTAVLSLKEEMLWKKTAKKDGYSCWPLTYWSVSCWYRSANICFFWCSIIIFSFCLSGGWCASSVFLEDNLYFSACVFQLLRLSPFSYKLKSGLCHFIYLEKENLHLWLP